MQTKTKKQAWFPLKEKASKHEKFRVSKDNEGKCFLEITGKNNKTIIIIRQENSNFELYKNFGSF